MLFNLLTLDDTPELFGVFSVYFPVIAAIICPLQPMTIAVSM